MEVLTIERNHLNLSPHSTASDMTSPNSSRLSDSGLFTSPPDDAIPESLPNKALSRNARAFSIDAILSNSDETEEENVEMGVAEQEEVGQEEERADDQDPLDNGDEPSLSDSTLPVDDTVFTSDRHTETRCILEMSDLWKKFHELGTEMIITKSGRRMFPSLRVSFSNLEPKARYQVYFDVTPVDNKRYRYAYHRSSWLVAGRADPPIPQRCYIHPDGPFIGESLQKQSISFEKVKLTNNVHDKWDYIVLNSMHKYQPRVHLVKLAADNSEPEKLHSVADLKGADRKVFIFTETQFIGVTAYQNQLITKLKIDSNPFAKGFRDSARITQIDRDSVDLLIKASRHAYPGAFIQQQLLHQQHINNLSPTSSCNSRDLYASSPSKFPSLHPPLPLFVPPHANSGGLSKDLFRFYLEQLSSNQDMASNTNKGTNMCSLQSRFHPYNR